MAIARNRDPLLLAPGELLDGEAEPAGRDDIWLSA
jgi:hypothetical protein